MHTIDLAKTCRVAWLICLTAASASCATPRMAETEAEGLSETRTAAAEARAAAAEARAAPVVDELELRVRDLSVDTLRAGSGVELAVRIPFENNPWVSSAAAETWQAEADAARAAASGEALADEVERCHGGVEAARFAEEGALHQASQDALEPLTPWARDLTDARVLDELSAAELELELALWLAERVPDPPNQPAPDDPTAWLLPPLDQLDTPAVAPDPIALRERIRASHPAARAPEAEARASEAEASLERDRALPWLSFVEVAYRFANGAGPGAIAANLAIAFPLGIEASGEAERRDAEAVAAELDARVRVLELERDALSAHAAMVAAADRRAGAAELLAVADEAEGVALAWREARRGTPRQVARVLRDVDAARRYALELRAAWARARCDWLAATAE